jgi:hypothetical protein
MGDARLIAIALLLTTGCPSEPRGQAPSSPSQRPPPEREHEVSTPMQVRLTQLQALIGLDQQAFIDRFGIRPEHMRDAAAYERMKDLTEIHHPAQAELGPARFYFRDGRLALIYLSDAAALRTLELVALKADLGDDGAVLRSRAGKTSSLHVYANRGMAFSAGKKLDFIEIFSPTTQQAYEQAIYVAPPAFAL